MAFRYTAEPRLGPQLLPAAVLIGCVVLGSTATVQAWWAELTELPDRLLLTGGFMVIHTLIFWTVCGAFHWVDAYDEPAFIARFRIQPDRRKHPGMDKVIPVLLRNQFLFLPVLLFGLGEALLLRGWTAEATLPSLPRLALELAGQGVIAVIVFYAGHRFLHRKYWMKRVHRVHHEFKTTTAWASEYAHPVEFVIGNFAALATGALILAPHLASMYLFAVLALLNILVHHSGYALPWASWSVPHDWHHYKMNELYGTTGFLDRLLGTSPEYEKLEDGDIR